MRDIIVVCMTHLSVMAGQAVVVPVPYRVIRRISGQPGVSLYRSVLAAVAVRRHTRTLSRGATRSAVQQLRLSAA